MFIRDLKALYYSRRKPVSVSAELALTEFRTRAFSYLQYFHCDITKIVLQHKLDVEAVYPPLFSHVQRYGKIAAFHRIISKTN